MDTLPDGSFVAASHLCIPDAVAEDTATVKALDVLTERFGTRYFRTEPEIEAFFADLPIVTPSPLTPQQTLVPCSKWYPTGPLLEHLDVDDYNVGAVAHKGNPGRTPSHPHS
ncbi:SAM-dependent methyltransferase [Amycolatopsis sp. BJA-103]|uniref:SAM-dependent methyltransferase n=1 Tax=Amycolatopsis sp. BJA-103 TaxID=1911175 RepID=UPI003FA48477